MTAQTGVVLVLANALATLAPQLIALVTLDPQNYGAFSLIYLAFAFGVSISYSTVSEVWVKIRNDDSCVDDCRRGGSDWHEYSRALLGLTGIICFLACALALVISDLSPSAALAGLAVSFALFRAGARYFEVRSGDFKRALRADLLMFSGTAVSVAVLILFKLPPTAWSIFGCWAIGGMAAVCVSNAPGFSVRSGFWNWVGRHRRVATPLLGESLLMDLGALGTPLLLFPLFNLGTFGVYRAVSSAAAPVRIVLNPLRPVLAGTQAVSLVSRFATVRIAYASAGVGSLVSCVLYLVGYNGWRIGVLSELSAYWSLVGVYVMANMFGHYWYLVARLHCGAKVLYSMRLLQTALAVAGPLTGALIFELPGAIWGLSVATLVSACGWMIGVRRSTEDS